MKGWVHVAWHSLPAMAGQDADRVTGAPHLAWAMVMLKALGGRCSVERLGGLSGEVFRFEMRDRPEDPAPDPFSAVSLHQGFDALGYTPIILCGTGPEEALDVAWAELSEKRPVLARGLSGVDWGMIVGLRAGGRTVGVWRDAVTWLDIAEVSDVGPLCFEIVTMGPRSREPAYPHTTREALGRAIRRMAAAVTSAAGTLSGYRVGENAWAALQAWHDRTDPREVASSDLVDVAMRLARRRCGAGAFLEKTKTEWLVAQACFSTARERFLEVAGAMHRVARLHATLPDDEAHDQVSDCIATARLRETDAIVSLRTAAEAIRHL